jgi:uncharacterized membrane protein YfcA
MISRIVLTIFIGIISGLVSGTLGVGTTSIMYPLLLLFNVIPEHKTLIGTMLFVLLLPISLFAVIEYGKRQQIDYLIGGSLCLSFFFASYYGSILNKFYNDKTLKQLSAFLFLIITIYLFYDAYK